MPTDALPPEIQRELEAINAALSGRPVDPELTELGALAVALREERQGPSLEFQTDLDRRVADGFRKDRRQRRRRWLPGSAVLAPVAVAMLLAIVVVPVALMDGGGGGGDEPSSSGSGAAGGGAAALSTGAAEQSSDSAAPVAPSSARSAKPQVGGSPSAAVGIPAPVPPPGGGAPKSDRRTERKQEKSASLTLLAKPADINNVAAKILDVARANRGFVVSSSVGSVEGGGSGQFLLRVPTAALDTTIAQLSDLGHVSELNRQTQDITAQHTSARSRLQDARAERSSLLRRLARAVTDAEVASLKAQLRDVGARIAAAKTDLSAVSNRATFANVAVSLAADSEAAAPGEDDDGRWSPGDAAKDAGRILEFAAGVVLVVLAAGLPLGLLVLAGVVAVRWSARRGRERALDAV